MTSGNAWAFTLDGHQFYVLSNVDGTSLVCDLTTGQWHRWFTAQLPFWNMLRGVTWRGLTIAADHVLPTIWQLAPQSTLDEGVHRIARTVTGFQAIRGKSSYRQGFLRLTASTGAPDAEGIAVRMRYSDDEGETWSRYFPVELQAGRFAQPISYRGLGRMRAPGRLWEISDTGGLVNLEGIDSQGEAP